MRPGLRAALAACVTFAAFTSGYALRPKLQPEPLYAAWAKHIQRQPSHKEPLEDGVIPTVMETDFSKLIEISSPQDAEALRAKAAAFIFRGDPAGMNRRPDMVEHDQSFPPLFDLELASIDILTVRMPFGIESRVYYLKPRNPQSCLMIYQEGHRVSFLERVRFIRRMTSSGCDVLALSLPLTGGMNNRPQIDHPRFGRLLLNDPDDLQLLNSRNYSSLAYFITPLVAALNHALDVGHYERIGATGFSGGGWAVQILAALDPRVQSTYSVAGSSPTTVHAAKPEWGSPEQRQGPFYELVNYVELYVMAADRPGRRHVQFFNETDPCCFAGHSWMSWNGPVGDRIRQLGGQYSLVTYSDSRHTMTKPVALAIVDDFLNGGKSPPAGVTIH